MNNVEIRRIARSNKSDALSKLKAEFNKGKKTANLRLKRTRNYYEKHGFQSRAERIATLRLSKMNLDKFELREDMDIEEISDLLIHMNSFLESETSLVRGIKKQEDILYRNIKAVGVKVKRKELAAFSEFLSQKLVRELIDFDSSRAFYEIQQAINNNVSISDLKKHWEDYVRGEVTFDEAWENWTGRNPFLD